MWEKEGKSVFGIKQKVETITIITVQWLTVWLRKRAPEQCFSPKNFRILFISVCLLPMSSQATKPRSHNRGCAWNEQYGLIFLPLNYFLSSTHIEFLALRGWGELKVGQKLEHIITMFHPVSVTERNLKWLQSFVIWKTSRTIGVLKI